MIIEKKTTAPRFNDSPAFSGILRLLDFDIPSGKSKIMIGNPCIAPAPIITELGYPDFMRIDSLSKRANGGHSKKVTSTVYIVDRWIVDAIINKQAI